MIGVAQVVWCQICCAVSSELNGVAHMQCGMTNVGGIACALPDLNGKNHPWIKSRRRAHAADTMQLGTPQFSRNRVSIKKTSGNEVYYTNALILLINMMLCSKFHCQKFFKLKLFSYKIYQRGRLWCPTLCNGTAAVERTRNLFKCRSRIWT